MNQFATVASVVVVVVASSGCIWFHERTVTVHVQNDVARVIDFQITMSRLAVFGNPIEEIYNKTHYVAGQGKNDVALSKVGNGNHGLRFSFRNTAGSTLERTIHLLYEESPEDDPTDVYVRIRTETAFDMEAPGRSA